MIRSALLFAALLLSSTGIAQDHRFQNPNQSLIALNPSFAGSNGGFRNQSVLRNQWINLSGNNQVFWNCTDFAIKRWSAGAAIELVEESRVPVQRDYGIAVVYAQQISLLENKLRIVPSLRVAHISRRVDLSSLTFNQARTFHWQTEPLPQFASRKILSFSTGFVSMIGSRVTAGAYVFHLNQPDEGLLGVDPLEARVLAHASYIFYTGEKTMLQGFARTSFQGNTRYTQVAVNALLCRSFVVGSGYGTDDNVFINAGYHHPRFNAMAGYDISFSRMASGTAGSWELQISASLAKERDRSVRPFEQF